MSSSSSSSSPTNSKRAAAGYVVAVFRRLFCSTTLPTYHPPSDHHPHSCHNNMDLHILDHHKDNNQLPPHHPGLMARLMGLETMPPPNSITRSRSMNSVEHSHSHSRQCDDPKQHRRVMSSVSFRELPMSLEQEDNDEFFVISFERSNSTSSKHKVNKRKIKRKKVEKMISMVVCDDHKPTSQCKVNYSMENTEKSLKPIDQKAISNAEKSSRRKMMKSNHHSIETGSDDSSPVSIFDFEEFVFDLEEDYPIQGSNSRRKLSLEAAESYDQPASSTNTDKSSTVEDKEPRRKGDGRNKWKQVCELAYEDIMETRWIYKDMGKLEVIEDISAGFEFEILQHLLNEMVLQQILN